jgi:hypothetical protein
MRGTKLGSIGSAAVLLAALGCSSPPAFVPSPPTDEVRLPPENDPRFSRPTEYPAETLNQPPVKKNYGGAPGMAGGPRGIGAGASAGMGGGPF